MSDRARAARLLAGTLCMLCLAAPALAQQAVFTGTVRAEPGSRPLRNAEVTIAELDRTVRTDSAGRFSMLRVPAGAYQIFVRSLGYLPHQEAITFADSGRIARDVVLKPTLDTLATVTVKASAPTAESSRLAEFEERRHQGFGRFLTRAELEDAVGRTLSSVLTTRISGLGSTMRGSMYSQRGVSSLRHGGPCFVQVLVDGMLRVQKSGDVFNVNSLLPETVAGIEYYTPANTPTKYNATGQASCGTLVIWTRW